MSLSLKEKLVFVILCFSHSFRTFLKYPGLALGPEIL